MNTPLGLQASGATTSTGSVVGNLQAQPVLQAVDVAQSSVEQAVFAAWMLPEMATAELQDSGADLSLGQEDGVSQDELAGHELMDAVMQLPALQLHWVDMSVASHTQEKAIQTTAKPPQTTNLLLATGSTPLQSWAATPVPESNVGAKASRIESNVTVAAIEGSAIPEIDLVDTPVQSALRVEQQPADGAAVSRERSAVQVQAPLSVRQAPQALMQALAQRIQVQQSEGVDVATVRLDPPQMGSLEIRIRQDASGVHVQFQASNAEIGRQLATLAEGLRQELQQRHQDASVSVAQSRFTQSNGQHGQQQDQHTASPEEPVIGQALQA